MLAVSYIMTPIHAFRASAQTHRVRRLTDRALPAPCLRLLALLLTGNEEEPIGLIVIIFLVTCKEGGSAKTP